MSISTGDVPGVRVPLEDASQDSGRRPTEPSPLATLSLVLVGSLVVLSTAVIAPALPAIGAHFSDDPRAAYLVPMLVTLPALTIGIAAPFAGYVLDRFGRHTAVLTALVAFVLFGIAGVLGGSLEWLLLTRAGLGLSVGFLMAGFTSLVGDLFEPARRSVILGRQVTLNAFMALGMTLAAGLLTEWDWRAMFLVYLAAVPLVFMFARCVPKTYAAKAGTSEGGPLEDERRVPWAIIASIYALGVLCMVFAMLVPTRSPFLIEQRYGGTAFIIAFAMSLFTVGMVPASIAFARLRAAMSSWTLFALGFAAMGLGFALQGISTTLPVLIAGMGVSGIGFGLIMPNLNTSLLAAAPARLRGRLSGGLVSAIFMGQFVSPIFSQPAVQRYDIQTSFLLGAAVILIVVIVCLVPVLRRRFASS